MALAFFAATFWSARFAPNWKFIFALFLYFSKMSLICPAGSSGATYFYVLWNAGIELACGRGDAMNVQRHSILGQGQFFCSLTVNLCS